MCRSVPTPKFVHSSYHLWAVQAGWNGNIATCNSRCWFRRIVVFICIFIICCIFDCEHLLSEDELLDWLRHLSQSFGQFRGDWSPKSNKIFGIQYEGIKFIICATFDDFLQSFTGSLLGVYSWKGWSPGCAWCEIRSPFGAHVWWGWYCTIHTESYKNHQVKCYTCIYIP